eukprot:TCALIF_05755-PA protein Name:"Protein of unknown function" AED:0.25 eAED:0.25 QI:32/0.5/0/0.66/1/0.33/3/0/366
MSLSNLAPLSPDLSHQCGPPSSLRRPSLGLSRSDPNLNALLEFNKSWRDKMRLPSDIILTQFIKDKASNLSTLIVDLQRQTKDLAESDFLIQEESPEEQQFAQTILNIRDCVDGILNYIDIVTSGRLSSKQAKTVQTIGSKHDPAADISIPFLGLDWHYMEILLASLHKHLNEVTIQILGRNDHHAPFFTLRMVCNVVRDLNKIKNDVMSHAEAVLEGRLNTRKREDMRIAQHRHRDLLQLLTLRSGSDREDDSLREDHNVNVEAGHSQKIGPRLRQLLLGSMKFNKLFNLRNLGHQPSDDPLGENTHVDPENEAESTCDQKEESPPSIQSTELPSREVDLLWNARDTPTKPMPIDPPSLSSLECH